MAPESHRAALSVHTVFSTACAPYFDWQSAGLGLSHRRVRQPGPLTRLIACSDAYYAERSLRVPHIGTHVHPDYGTASGVAGFHSEEEEAAEADAEEEEVDGWDAIDALIGLIVCVAGAGAALLLRTARRSVARALLPASSPLRRKRRL